MTQAGLLAGMAAAVLAAGVAVPAPAHAALATVADQNSGGGIQSPAQPQTQEPQTQEPQTQGSGRPHNGVIRPPQANIDPHMTVKPPHPGSQSMPVIPPPGSPGGKEDIQPR